KDVRQTATFRFTAWLMKIGGKGNGTAGINIDILVERDDPLAVCSDFIDAQARIAHSCRRADAHFAARVDHALPTRWPETLQKQEFNPAVIGESPCCQHARIV